MIATQKVRSNRVADAALIMTHGITRPKPVRWLCDDRAKGRHVNPLGNWYPKAAELCIRAGQYMENVLAPLHEEEARLRSLAGERAPSLPEAILTETEAEGDANEAEAVVALCGTNPTKAALETCLRKTERHHEAEGRLIQAMRAKLIEMGEK